MADFEKLNDEILDDVSGGVKKTVKNDTVDYANVREAPGLTSKVIGTVKNGTTVNTTGKHVTKDGYPWYEITFSGGKGWIAGSLIGY